MLYDAFPFTHRDPLVCFDVPNFLNNTLRPADRQICFGGMAKAEVHSEVTLGNMVPAAADFIDLPATARGERQPCANCVSSGSCDRADQQSVSTRTKIFQKRWRLEEIHHNEFFGTIVVEIANGKAS